VKSENKCEFHMLIDSYLLYEKRFLTPVTKMADNGNKSAGIRMTIRIVESGSIL